MPAHLGAGEDGAVHREGVHGAGQLRGEGPEVLSKVAQAHKDCGFIQKLGKSILPTPIFISPDKPQTSQTIQNLGILGNLSNLK